jgi:hypothetical protein
MGNFILKYFNETIIKIQGFKSQLVDLIKSRYIKVFLLANIGLNVILWYASYRMNADVSQNLIVLHYNVDFGINMIGSVKSLYILPLLGLFIFLVNVVIILMLRKEDKFLNYLLLFASTFSNLFLNLAIGFLYLINFR